jgi:hypothetical protein
MPLTDIDTDALRHLTDDTLTMIWYGNGIGEWSREAKYSTSSDYLRQLVKWRAESFGIDGQPQVHTFLAVLC